MRMLFNHGFSVEELFTATPKKVIDRKWSWFIERYGPTRSYEDAISEPFKYCLTLVFNKVLDDKIRFIIPGVIDSYIDYEIVTGDKFEKQRQNGRFQKIDFIESDFTGYALQYCFKGKAYQKVVPIYFGGDLKRKFEEGINSGVKYYTVRNFTLYDLLPEIEKKFPELTGLEIKKIIAHGFRRMHSCIKYGCAISLSIQKFGSCVAYIGKISTNPAKQIKEYSIRRDKKLRKMEAWQRPPFDGYYYIGINETAFKIWYERNKTSRSISHFTRIKPRKIKEELYYKDKHLYIFRFKRKTFKGWCFWAETLEVRKMEYLGEVLDRKFYPSTLTWRQLIKEYEKREHE